MKTKLFYSLALASLFSLNTKAQIPTVDLVVEYKFDNNLSETSGSSYNAGTLVSGGTVSYDQGFDANQAVDLDGQLLSNVGNITFTGNVKEYVTSFWFKTNGSITTGQYNLLQLTDPIETSNGLTVQVRDNGATLRIEQNAIGSWLIGEYYNFANITDNAWHHLAVKVVYWPSGQKYYVRAYLDDAIIINENEPISGSNFSNNVWVYGGLNIYMPNQYAETATPQDLQIDNFRFYEAPITDEQLSALYGEVNAVSPCENIVNIPDSNFKAALLVHGTDIGGADPEVSVIDTDGDGEICLEEAQAYTGAIQVGNRDIEDLTGLEAFTNIITLNCSYNDLSSIDLNPNTALKKLYCNANDLTELDLSANTALQELKCQDNELTQLGLSTNTALSQLWCHSNELTQLDVSTNTALQDINCGDNLLTSLNLANGYNNEIIKMQSDNNFPTLTCIQHDAGFTPPAWDYSLGEGWQKDETANWSEGCSIGIYEADFDDQISIYPNPVTNIMTIDVEDFKTFIIFDLSGKEILKTNSNKINISELTNGIYLVKVTNIKGFSAFKKILKQ